MQVWQRLLKKIDSELDFERTGKLSSCCITVSVWLVNLHGTSYGFLYLFYDSCYCCKNTKQAMDIDTALDDLGMLSTITNSRKQYLRERIRTRSETAHSDTSARSLHIVRLDKNYVNDITSGTFGTFYPSIDPGSDISVDPNSPSSSLMSNNHNKYRDSPSIVKSSRSLRYCLRLLVIVLSMPRSSKAVSISIACLVFLQQ
jgi:hypothetical protein